ncbi:MAG: BREX-2 system adenine-specific DNA-methyltransferase PglX [Candidatus Xenobia bacterium]
MTPSTQSSHTQLSTTILTQPEQLGHPDLQALRQSDESLQKHIIALQEELDWTCYEAYNLVAAPTAALGELPEVLAGQRPFEILLARALAAGENSTGWFRRHHAEPSLELPPHWPDAYKRIVEQRIALIEANPNIALIEQPEHKRRWQQEPWEDRVERALRTWLLNRLESAAYWPEVALTSCSRLADRARRDADFMQVARLYRNSEEVDVTKLVEELVTHEAVPFLPALRYTESGLLKREQWERTWDLQRQEDAGQAVGKIPVPPKYAQADFKSATFWRLRGKLDVPRERFISYPGAERDADRSLVIGWAGWNHAQQAQALTAYYADMRETEGWREPRLIPLLSGLAELLPWIHQWHPDVDPDTGERPGPAFQAFLEEEARALRRTIPDLRAWRPTPTASARGRRKKL